MTYEFHPEAMLEYRAAAVLDFYLDSARLVLWWWQLEIFVFHF